MSKTPNKSAARRVRHGGAKQRAVAQRATRATAKSHKKRAGRAAPTTVAATGLDDFCVVLEEAIDIRSPDDAGAGDGLLDDLLRPDV